MNKNKLEQGLIQVIFAVIAVCCLIPFWLLISASLTDENAIIQNGYSFFPGKFSLESYRFLFQDSSVIFNAYGVSIFVTVIGTFASLAIMTLLAYPLSKKDMPLRNFFSFFIFFTMLFNGGLVSTYLMYTNLFDIKNTLLALIIPGLLVNAFYVILLRTFFSVSIPGAVLESAHIDGAGEFKIFLQMVLPLSLPVLATVGLFQVINYWNDWFNGLIYITDNRYYSIQVLLNTILLNVQYLLDNAEYSSRVDEAGTIPTQGVRIAIAVIGVLPILVAYPFFQKYFVKGLTVGAIKG
ncbi:carbohydrate ABC transporter permease [Paenibacillus eucommiae]|uniref:Aldouronate transport system permease protein n=1 Tax=Paenibacillus eucommiae TaxID=1355755 RepID=A0ABS4J6B7_9BACL|nr:putative aldouronate transport system permease protein [Paenibacillus eucommiae]